MTNKNIDEWVKLAVKNEDITDWIVEIEGKSSNVDGYIGSIVFVTVLGKSKTGSKKSLNLVIKSSKDSETLRQQVPVQWLFEKEIHIYSVVLPAFKQLERECGANLLDLLPHCYATDMKTAECLVFENLKSQDYEICDRMATLPYEHSRLVLEAYGRWHAFSLALKNKHPGKFSGLVANNRNMFSTYIVKVGIFDVVLENFNSAKDALVGAEDRGILNFSKNDAKRIIVDSFFEDPVDQVILHGDCWNNNFMFKSQNGGPVNVRLLDWQLSAVASPVMDLSHFIYCSCDTGTHRNVEDFLKIYHNSLSKSLHLLGCASDVFSYTKLMEHWKKYSIYGLFMSPFCLRFIMCDSEDAPDFAESAEQGKPFLENFYFEIKNKEMYNDRLRNNFVHYIENVK